MPVIGADRRPRPRRRDGAGRRVRHRRRRAREHVRADRGAHRGRAVDHLADAAAEDDPRGPPAATSSPARSSAPTRPRAIGLITVAADDVDGHGRPSCVADIAAGSPQGLAASKALTTAPMLDGFDRDAERADRRSRRRLFVSDEAREGMLAFLQKRPPRWVSGR